MEGIFYGARIYSLWKLASNWAILISICRIGGLSWQLSWYRIYLLCRKCQFSSWVWKIPWRRDGLPTSVLEGFPGGPDGKESAYSADPSSIPGLGISNGGAYGNPLQYSCLEDLHRQRSLAGYSPCGHKELDITEQLSRAQHMLDCYPISITQSFNYTILNLHSRHKSVVLRGKG